MAFSPIAFTIPEYDRTLYANHWLKAYEPGTTMPKPMAIDSAGSSQASRFELNSQGFPITSGDALVIPHIEGNYDLWLFPTSAEADANDTSNALQFADNISTTGGSIASVTNINFATVADMAASSTLAIGNFVSIESYTATNNSGVMFGEVVAGGTGVADGGAFIDLISVGLQFKQHLSMSALTPQLFGAEGDGITDDTSAIESAGAYLDDNSTLDFGSSSYLVSKSGVPSSPYGHNIIELVDKNNVTIKADSAIIKLVNHDISSNGGITFIHGTACSKLTVKGFHFDLSYVGVHTGSTQYPQCSAIRGDDPDNATAGVRGQDSLNGDWSITGNTFKCFHPFGQYAQSGSSFGGDPNNGFKILPVFVSGPFDATSYNSQCRNVEFCGNTFKEGHNGYGFWAWAWNNVIASHNTAESFVGKQSNSSGTLSGRGEPMIRYHQFYCTGLTVTENFFRAKPCDERLVAGFEGDSRFVDYNTNLLGNFGHGTANISNNTIVCGRGDAANSLADWYINTIAYGSINISNNVFTSTNEVSNANISIGIFWNPEAVGSQGIATMAIKANTFSSSCDWLDNIVIANGATTPAQRRLKQLVVEGNTSLGQAQYFFKVGNTGTSYGVQDLRITNNLINGEYNLLFPTASSNSRAIQFGGSESSDIEDVSRNTIRSKYYAFQRNTSSAVATADYNEFLGITTAWLGAIPITTERSNSAPTSAAADGSVYIRKDGVVGFSFYVRQAGAWTVVG